MAEKLKNLMNAQLVRALANDLRRAYPSFHARAFASECIEPLDRLELTQRAWHIAEVMSRHLPSPFAAAAAGFFFSVTALGDDDGFADGILNEALTFTSFSEATSLLRLRSRSFLNEGESTLCFSSMNF